jgi:hypothetical protein
MEPPFVSVNSTVCPSRTWTIGPGAVDSPSKAQTLYFTPGAISTVLSFMTMLTFTTSPACRAGRLAS